ncbi:hypothetical protein C3469_04030 [Mycobacterium kansasii]|uniref:DUF222 domain-containing protein n=1 Tax=Mycobacterium kansasii TaxID=1768 RepID=UPI000CDD4B98|nr:hypothetical protein C3479_06730 [Mycobacterium kansasii]POY29224.1 hypothetical protein C3469_04030 [Mycobacterium kansasii]
MAPALHDKSVVLLGLSRIGGQIGCPAGWTKPPERAEAQLARQASQFRREQLAELAATLADCLNPDGTYRLSAPFPSITGRMQRRPTRRHAPIHIATSRRRLIQT